MLLIDFAPGVDVIHRYSRLLIAKGLYIFDT